MALALALVAGTGGGAPAIQRPPIVMRDSMIGPEPVGLDFRNERRLAFIGETVLLVNEGAMPHELEDTMGLVRWGPVLPGSELLVRPPWPGSYELRDRLEPALESVARWEHMTLDVAPVMDPYRRRPLVRWALEHPPEGFVFDVQRISRTGGRWEVWKRGVRSVASSFRWSTRALVSCIGFRARLRSPGDPARTLDWGQGDVQCVVV